MRLEFLQEAVHATAILAPGRDRFHEPTKTPLATSSMMPITSEAWKQMADSSGVVQMKEDDTAGQTIRRPEGQAGTQSEWGNTVR